MHRQASPAASLRLADGVDEVRGKPTVNLAECLRETAARLPGKPALEFRGEPITYGVLDGRVQRAAAALAGLGLRAGQGGRPGDRVALLVGNSPHFAEALFGAWRAGLVAVPMNVGFTAEELAWILDDSGARAVVASAPFIDALASARAGPGELEHVVVAGASQPVAGAHTWRALLERAGEVAGPPVGEDALALLQYTSGTTGRPKAAMLTHANLLANHRQMSQSPLRLKESDVVLCVLPLFHIYALNVVLAYALARGATLLLLERFDPLETLRAVERHRATVIVGAPPMYTAWVNTPGAAELDLASVRFAVSGAAALPATVLGRFRDTFGITVWEGYGTTEASPVLTTAALGGDDSGPLPDSVGRPLPGVELRLVGDRGEPVRQGDPGEVLVRGPNVFSGYWQQPEETARVLDDDGWFHTGDIGYADGGELHLVDRKNDLVIVSGFNVYPREVEAVLHSHPKVSAAAVVGAPHPYTGECVKAHVQLAPGEEASPEELIAFCRRSLARFKVPEIVEFTAELPLLPSGKVHRKTLRDRSG